MNLLPPSGPNPLSPKQDKREVHTVRSAIKQPDWLRVRTEQGDVQIGPDQSWFASPYQRRRGCGPTTAALICAYTARKPGMVSLFRPYKGAARAQGLIDPDYVFSQEAMRRHMDDLWRYVRPGPGGLWRSSMMARGLRQFTAARGARLETQRFLVPWLKPRNPRFWPELLQFIRQQLRFDIPLAWLVYDRGKMDAVQSWHWVCVTGIRYQSDFGSCTLELVDHGRQVEVDLQGWYYGSRLGGAFVSLRPATV